SPAIRGPTSELRCASTSSSGMPNWLAYAAMPLARRVLSESSVTAHSTFDRGGHLSRRLEHGEVCPRGKPHHFEPVVLGGDLLLCGEVIGRRWLPIDVQHPRRVIELLERLQWTAAEEVGSLDLAPRPDPHCRVLLAHHLEGLTDLRTVVACAPDLKQLV